MISKPVAAICYVHAPQHGWPYMAMVPKLEVFCCISEGSTRWHIWCSQHVLILVSRHFHWPAHSWAKTTLKSNMKWLYGEICSTTMNTLSLTVSNSTRLPTTLWCISVKAGSWEWRRRGWKATRRKAFRALKNGRCFSLNSSTRGHRMSI